MNTDREKPTQSAPCPRIPIVKGSLADLASKLTSTKAILRTKPVINSVTDALTDLSCLAERLDALLWSNTEDMHHLLVDAGDVPPLLRDSAYRLWMIQTLANEKFAELCEIIDAINEAAHAERRAVAS